MEKMLSLIFICIVSAVSYAQPSFTSVPVPVEGYSYNAPSVIYNDADPAAEQGANHSWDYSSLSFGTGGATTTLHTDMSSATYSGFFTAASHYTKISSSEIYYVNTSTSRSELGLFDGTSVIKYDNPLILFSYPIAYSDVQSRTFSCNFTQNSYPSTLNGTLSTTYDGYGTLTVGTDVINNSARYKIVRDQTIATSFSSARTITTTYAWYLPGEFIPRFAIEYITVTVDGNPFSSSHKAYKYSENVTTAISEKEQINARLYPQPASGSITVEAPDMNGKVSYRIYKTDGATVKSDEVETDGSGIMTVNLSDVLPGFYVIEMISGNKAVKEKLIIT